MPAMICEYRHTMSMACATFLEDGPKNSPKMHANSTRRSNWLLPGMRAMASERKVAARDEETQMTTKTSVGTTQPDC